MSDSINVDFSPLHNAPDPVTTYQNAFAAGRALAGQQITGNAMQAYAANPTTPLDPQLAAANPQQYMALKGQQQTDADRQSTIAQATAQASGDFHAAAVAAAARGATADVSQLNDQQKQATADFSDQVGGVIHGIAVRTQDPNQRLSLIDHYVQTSPKIAQLIQSLGLDPAHLTAADVSDQSLGALYGQMQGLKASVKNDEPEKIGKDESLIYKPGSLGAAQASQGAGAAPAATPAPPEASAPVSATPVDRDALIKAVLTEAGGESPTGQAAVAHVILNRAKAGYGGAQSIADVVNAPGQFEGMTSGRANVSPNSPAYQRIGGVVDAVLKGQTPDPTGGADHFLNPTLQSDLGRAQPSWADGSGLKIGNHVFYGGNGKPADSYDVASNGATPPPPSGRQTLPGGYVKVSPNADGPDEHGHVSTAAELKAAGLPVGTQGWTDAKGEIKPLPDKFTAGGTGGSGDATKTGSDYLASLQPGQRAMVQAVIDGRSPLPSNPRTPAQFALAQDVNLADPGFNSATFKEREGTYNDMFSTKGKTAQGLRSMSTAMDHAASLSNLIDKLHNDDTPLVGGVINSVKNAFDPNARSVSSQMGPLIQQLSIEAASAAQGGSPHEAEVQGYLKTLRDPNSQPTEQRGALMGIVSALKSRYDEIQSSYDRSKSPVGSPLAKLSPDALAAIQKIAGLQKRLSGGGSAPVAPASQGQGKVLNWNPKTGALE